MLANAPNVSDIVNPSTLESLWVQPFPDFRPLTSSAVESIIDVDNDLELVHDDVIFGVCCA